MKLLKTTFFAIFFISTISASSALACRADLEALALEMQAEKDSLPEDAAAKKAYKNQKKSEALAICKTCSAVQICKAGVNAVFGLKQIPSEAHIQGLLNTILYSPENEQEVWTPQTNDSGTIAI